MVISQPPGNNHVLLLLPVTPYQLSPDASRTAHVLYVHLQHQGNS